MRTILRYPFPAFNLGGGKDSLICESGSARQFVGVAILDEAIWTSHPLVRSV